MTESNDPMKKNGIDYGSSHNTQTGKQTKKMHTKAGAPVYNDFDTMTAGKRGPVPMQDVWLIEKLGQFNRENIPERIMHAKGSGAYGTFRVTNDITQYTKAKIFSEVGKETEMFARFSTVAGERGAADAERDIRGFALKFYTEEGNWDMAGNNTPVFFLRDPRRFTDLNHAIKRDPKTNLRSPHMNWDFWTSMPESLFQLTITMSDRGLPSSYRYMHGFSSHAYSMINADNERVWVQYHFRSQQGIQNLTDQEAGAVVADDRESHQRDLYHAIEQGNYPKWKMYIQVMTEEEAEQLDYNPFDLTKVWYKEDFPLIEVGEFELNKNPENYHLDVEQAAFEPSNTVPGLGFSPDRMLQARLFGYQDAARYRIGANYWQVPVNYPRGVEDFHPYHKRGAQRIYHEEAELHYSPNSYGNWEDSPEHEEPPLTASDLDYYDFRGDDADYYTQPGKLFRNMTPEQQLVLFENTARNMGDASLQVKYRHIVHCYMADPDYGRGVAEALGLDIEAIDLTPMKSDSREQWLEDLNRFSDLQEPSEPADPETAKDLGPEGRDTNADDPKDLIDWETDPHLL